MDSDREDAAPGRPRDEPASTAANHRDDSDPGDSAQANAIQPRDGEESESEHTGPLPELVRKALAMGLTGLFTTEQTIRKALGDTVPKEWVDFVSDQSERTRTDFTDAIASEVGRTLRGIDLNDLAERLLSGRTLEINTRIRLLPHAQDNDEPAPDEASEAGKATDATEATDDTEATEPEGSDT